MAERYIDWRTRLGELGIICAEITGDTDHDDIAVIGKSQVDIELQKVIVNCVMISFFT